MKTDLAPIFAPILERTNDAYQLYPSATDGDKSDFAEYERLRTAIRNSPAMKVSASVQDADSLWRFTRIGAILGEVALLNGKAPIGSEGIGDRLCRKVSEDAFIRRVLWFFDSDAVQRWAEEAEPFIRDGRVVFLPTRGIARITVTDPNLRTSELCPPGTIGATADLDVDDDWTLADDNYEALKNRSTAITAVDQEITQAVTLFEIALPFIANTSLGELHRVLVDEEDTLAAFRAAVAHAFGTYVSDLSLQESPDKLQRVGATIRRNIIEPQLEALTRSLKRIVQTRAIRLAGATFGTVALGLTASAVQPLSAIVQAVLGTGGVGLIAREYAEYRTELLGRKENPWYFAWALRERTKS